LEAKARLVGETNKIKVQRQLEFESSKPQHLQDFSSTKSNHSFNLHSPLLLIFSKHGKVHGPNQRQQQNA